MSFQVKKFPWIKSQTSSYPPSPRGRWLFNKTAREGFIDFLY